MGVSTRVNGVLNPGACLANGEYRIDRPLGQGVLALLIKALILG